jgi:hypothetical protein
MIHDLFFRMAAPLVYDLGMSFAPLLLGYYAFRWLNNTIWDNGDGDRYRFSLKYFSMTVGVIILLVMILPESSKVWKHYADLEKDNPDPIERSY